MISGSDTSNAQTPAMYSFYSGRRFSMSNDDPILAIDKWKTNGALIADCHRLKYIEEYDSVTDVTYGLGTFWSEWKPKGYLFQGTDIDPAKSPDDPNGVDFCKLPYDDKSYDVVVYDPPYKMNGKPDEDVDARYGVHVRARWQDRWSLIYDGLEECCRVARRRVLMKCAASVVSGRVRWQDIEAVAVAEKCGFGLRDRFEFLSYREQPEGRSQKTARRNASTLLVLERDWKWRP